VRTSLEFHDSTLSGIAREGTSVRLILDAYVHLWDVVRGRWKGTGWVQPVQITVDDGVMSMRSQIPIELAGGVLRIGHVVHDNLVPLPCVSSESASLRLELVSGGVLEITGSGFAVQSTGVGEFVEDLPDEWTPSDAL
jgi:hypothetical protein